jgi:hypothetical protein
MRPGNVVNRLHKEIAQHTLVQDFDGNLVSLSFAANNVGGRNLDIIET